MITLYVLITLYSLISAFTMGLFVGEVHGHGAYSQVKPKEWAGLALLAMVWPFVVYLYVTDPKEADDEQA